MAGPTPWLTDDEQETWRALIVLVQGLESSLDRQLQRDAGMPHAYYGILVMLSEAEEGTLRMSELARRLRFSQSRLTHAVSAMARQGWVRRERCPTDGRGFNAVLEPSGRAALAAAAPGHVAEVRRLVFDRLDVDAQHRLRDACQTLLTGLVEDGAPA